MALWLVKLALRMAVSVGQVMLLPFIVTAVTALACRMEHGNMHGRGPDAMTEPCSQ
jgi:hypothetical protein